MHSRPPPAAAGRKLVLLVRHGQAISNFLSDTLGPDIWYTLEETCAYDDKNGTIYEIFDARGWQGRAPGCRHHAGSAHTAVQAAASLQPAILQPSCSHLAAMLQKVLPLLRHAMHCCAGIAVLHALLCWPCCAGLAGCMRHLLQHATWQAAPVCRLGSR